MGAVPERLSWAVEMLDVRPADRILELGCGPGAAVELVCARLTKGWLIAVDQAWGTRAAPTGADREL